MPVDFTHLHVHTSIGSMQDSMNRVDELFDRAKELGQKAIAITDHGTMAAMYDARKASIRTGVKFIPGIEAYFVNDLEAKESRRHIVLLAQNEIGYKNILRMNYEGYVNNQFVGFLRKVFPRIDWNILRKYSEGVICLTACGSGIVAREIFKYDDQNEFDESSSRMDSIKVIKKLQDIFGDRLYLEIQPHDLSIKLTERKTGNPVLGEITKKPVLKVDQDLINRTLISLSKELGLKFVVTSDVHYLKKEHCKIHDMLMAISDKKALSDKTRHRYEVEEFYLKSGDEIHGQIASMYNEKVATAACKSSMEIANRCEQSDYLDCNSHRFPIFKLEDEKDYERFSKWYKRQDFYRKIPEDHAFLRYRCMRGFKSKYGNLDKKTAFDYKKRIKDEIEVLEMHNFSSYMLIVADYIDYARKTDIPVGPGRGCLSGNCLVKTASGMRKLKNINVGDIVFTHDNKKRKVTKVFEYDNDEDLIEIMVKNKKTGTILTKDHKVYCFKTGLVNIGSWIPAETVNVGDKLWVSVNGNIETVNVTNINKVSGINKVFDLEIEKSHSYSTVDFIVHNSVGGSLVAHLIGVHEADPIKYGLLFERFHNKEKKSFPDIDTDFEPSGRELVQKYIVDKYGEENVAHVSNLSKSTLKVTVKDLARSLELGGSKSAAFSIANRITNTIADDAKTFEEARAKSVEFDKYCETYPDLLKYGNKLVGLERAYSTHAAGVLISDISLPTYVPLRLDKDGAVSVQYEKNRSEDMGLIKMDLLGLEHLRIIKNTIANIKGLGKECPTPETMGLKFDDMKVWKDIALGKTVCVFQMESQHMSALCKRVRPMSIEDLSIINALGRPSAKTSREIYIRRRNKQEKVAYKYPCLKEALDETLGICVYEEQLSKLASTVAGWDLNKADGLRKLTKLKSKGKKLAEKLKADFIKDASAFSKISKKDAEGIWVEVIEPFAGYGFNKSHGILYSMNGYHSAYYKHYYPAEFMAAALKSEVEKPPSPVRDDNIRMYKDEAKSMGIEIVPPSVNKSGQSFTVLNDKSIVMGLETIKGVGSSAVGAIIDTRDKGGDFQSFQDFLNRCPSNIVKKGVIESLAKAGCFDELGVTRKTAHDYYPEFRATIKKLRDSKKNEVPFENIDKVFFSDDIYKQEWNKKDLLQSEAEVMGEYISGSISDVYAGIFNDPNATLVGDIMKLGPNNTIKSELLVKSVKKLKISRGKNAGSTFGKCVAQDKNSSEIEITFWPEQWAKYSKYLSEGAALKIIGKTNVYNDKISLVCQKIEKIYKGK